MGVVLCVIGITNLAPLLARLFTLPIVRGIQLGLGLLLARGGIHLILESKGASAAASALPTSSVFIALGAAGVLLAFRKSRRFPAALILLGAGLLLGIAAHWRALPSPSWSFRSLR